MLTVLADTFMIATWLDPRDRRAEGKQWVRQDAVPEPDSERPRLSKPAR